jgi:hypothetical protein
MNFFLVPVHDNFRCARSLHQMYLYGDETLSFCFNKLVTISLRRTGYDYFIETGNSYQKLIAITKGHIVYLSFKTPPFALV